MNPQRVNLCCEIELQTGEKLALPDEIVDRIGAGRWLISIVSIVETANLPTTRYHDAFLNSYTSEDEGLYDDYSAR
jgi:hypothetical protein